MEIKYILVYGEPYLKTKFFSSFKDMSGFIVNKSIVDYQIFKEMIDDEEIKLICEGVEK